MLGIVFVSFKVLVMFNDLIKDAEDVINGLRQLRNATDDAESLEVIQKIGVIIKGMKNEMKKKQEKLDESFAIIVSPKDVLEELHDKGYNKATIDDAKDFIAERQDNSEAIWDNWNNYIEIFCEDKGIECED